MGAFKNGELIKSWRIEPDSGKTADEFGVLVAQFFSYEGLDLSI